MNPLSRGHLEVAVPVSSDRGTLVSKALRDGLHDTPAPGLRSRARRCALGPQCDASLAVKGAVPNGRRGDRCVSNQLRRSLILRHN